MMIAPVTIFSFQGRYKMNGGNPDLKKLWDAGKLPTVKHGFYGDELTHQNISREHLEPASKGGTKRFGNIVLASKEKNNARGNKDINLFANVIKAREYLSQFIGIKIPELNGHKYIQEVVDTLKRLGFDLK